MPSRVSSRQTRARRRAGTPPADAAASSDEEVTFRSAPAAADPEDDVSTLAGSEDEAPEAVGLSDARREAETLLRDLADSRRRRDDSRRQRDRARQERNREQKLDKQRRLEEELMHELAAELEEDEAAEEAAAPGAGGRRTADGAPVRPKKKRFKYPTPAATGAMEFIPLAEGESTSFKAAALPASELPAVVNPELLGLRERLLYSGRIPRTSSRGLRQLRHKQRASGKYGRR